MNHGLLVDKEGLVKEFPALGSKPYRIENLIRSGKLPHIRVGKLIFFNTAEISDWLSKHKKNTTERRG